MVDAAFHSLKYYSSLDATKGDGLNANNLESCSIIFINSSTPLISLLPSNLLNLQVESLQTRRSRIELTQVSPSLS